jgi:hypothetical protein
MIEITVEGEFTQGMESLRTRVFNERNGTLQSSRDEDDNESIHVTAFLAGRPVGMVRLTQNPRHIVRAWHVSGRLPPLDRSVAMSRFVIDPEHRGTGLMRLLAFTSLVAAESLGGEWAIAAVEKASLSDFLRRAGWGVLLVTATVDLYGEHVPARVLGYKLTGTRSRNERRIANLISVLSTIGVQVSIGGLGRLHVSTPSTS